MRIGLYNIDSVIPNLALMKIAAFHKARRDTVDWYTPIEKPLFDKVYAASVFPWSRKDYVQDDMICGGTGFSIDSKLPKSIENCEPDYSIYPKFLWSIGFTTRGCIRKCSYCIVPEKEGEIRPDRDIETICQGRKVAVLLDNNALAHPHGIRQIERSIDLNIRIDYNQGLDARLITDDIAHLLSKVHLIRFIRMACDNLEMIEPVNNAVNLLGKYGIKPYKISIYLLIQDLRSALIRINTLRKMGVDIFAQAYRNQQGDVPLWIFRELERWVNIKKMFKTHSFEDFLQLRRGKEKV